MLTQAELLTEILGHYTRARTVTRMVWMITWLVVVHLIGWVICIKRRESSDGHKKCFMFYVSVQSKPSLGPFFCGEHTFFKLDFCPQPVMKKKKTKTDVQFKMTWFKICWQARAYYQIKIYYNCNQWWYHACASFFSFEERFLHQPKELDGLGLPSPQIHTPLGI